MGRGIMFSCSDYRWSSMQKGLQNDQEDGEQRQDQQYSAAVTHDHAQYD